MLWMVWQFGACSLGRGLWHAGHAKGETLWGPQWDWSKPIGLSGGQRVKGSNCQSQGLIHSLLGENKPYPCREWGGMPVVGGREGHD